MEAPEPSSAGIITQSAGNPSEERVPCARLKGSSAMKYLGNLERTAGLLRQLWQGLGITMGLFGYTLLFSLPLGLILTLMRMSRHKPLRWPVQLLSW